MSATGSKRRRLRIAVGQISSESNHFVAAPCELDFFRNTGFLHEREELFGLSGSGCEVSGMLQTLASTRDVEVVPLLAARANSSGPLSESCYRYLKEGLLAPLREAGHVDGVLLSHHGSMAAENQDDPEGDIALAVREIVGTRVPLIMTLDLHGNVTPRMVESATAILGYEQYPHYDVHATGIRAAELLLRVLRGEVRPVMAHAKLPMIVTCFNGATAGDGPFARLMRQTKMLERQAGILSASIFAVGSYIDIPGMGCSCIVIADGDLDRAAAEARKLAEAFWEARTEFVVPVYSVAAAVALGRKIDGGPVLLLDTADTTGGGAMGDGIGLVRGLVEAGVREPSVAMVVDPQTVSACLRAGLGAELTVDLGHSLDPRWGVPMRLKGRVVRLCDGRFQYTGGILGGSWVSMGPSVVFQTGSIQVLIMTYPTYDWADEQYRSAGLDPSQAKFVGVKNMMNFRHAYRDVMKAFFVLDLPGPTPPDMRMLDFHRIQRPVFPLDESVDPEVPISLSCHLGYS